MFVMKASSPQPITPPNIGTTLPKLIKPLVPNFVTSLKPTALLILVRISLVTFLYKKLIILVILLH